MTKIKHIIVGDPSCDDCEICKAMAKAEKEGREITPEEADRVERSNLGGHIIPNNWRDVKKEIMKIIKDEKI